MARIVVPFDGDPASECALVSACQVLVESTDVVEVIYVVRVPPQLPINADVAAARGRAAAAFARAAAITDHQGVTLVEVLVTARAVGPGIVAAAAGCDLLLMSRHARRRALRLPGQRVLRYVLAHAPCQVLVVPVPTLERVGARDTPFLLSPRGAPDPHAGTVLLFPASPAHGAGGRSHGVRRVSYASMSGGNGDRPRVTDATRDG